MKNLANLQTNVPRIGVGAVVWRAADPLAVAHVLLGLRLNKDGHGHKEWAFPGGKLDWMESIDQCAVRETMEEAGIVITPIRQIGITNDFWPEPINKHFLTVYVSCACAPDAEPKVMEPEKCEKWQWWPVDALPAKMMLGSAEILKRMFPWDFQQQSEDNANRN